MLMVSKLLMLGYSATVLVAVVVEATNPEASAIARSVLFGAGTGCWYQLRLFMADKVRLVVVFVETFGTVLSSYAAFAIAYVLFGIKEQMLLDLCCMGGGLTGALGVAKWASKRFGVDIDIDDDK